jgi:excisionase family DNA binding protein
MQQVIQQQSSPGAVRCDSELLIPRLLTVEDAAAALTVSEVTVRTWMRQRRLTKVKLGRRVAVTAESVAALIRGGLE